MAGQTDQLKFKDMIYLFHFSDSHV